MDERPAPAVSDRPQVAVGAIVVDNDMLVMVRRATDPGRGLWTIPGGRVEHGEYLADAVVREVAEETALEVVVGELAGFFEVVGDPHYVILDFFARPVGERTLVAQKDEIADAAWVHLDAVEELECTPRLLETLRAWSVLRG